MEICPLFLYEMLMIVAKTGRSVAKEGTRKYQASIWCKMDHILQHTSSGESSKCLFFSGRKSAYAQEILLGYFH